MDRPTAASARDEPAHIRPRRAPTDLPRYRRPIADEVDWRTGDVTDGAAVSDAAIGCDAVIALAGLLTPACRADPILGARVNLIGTLNVFEAALRHRIGRVIYTSSAGVYGRDDAESPRPMTHYGAFKLACEGSARAYFADHGLASIGFRPFIVYGPGRETGVSAGPSLACRAAARGEPYVIPFSGRAGLVYVEDVAAAYDLALLAQPNGAQVFNLVGAQASSEDVVAAIRLIIPDARLASTGQIWASSAMSARAISTTRCPACRVLRCGKG